MIHLGADTLRTHGTVNSECKIKCGGINGQHLYISFRSVYINFFGGEADKPIEFVSFRLGITVPLRELPLLAEESGQALKAQAIEMFDERAWRKGQLLSRSGLKVGRKITGPALLEDPTSTLLVPAGWTASRDKNDNTILRRKS